MEWVTISLQRIILTQGSNLSLLRLLNLQANSLSPCYLGNYCTALVLLYFNILKIHFQFYVEYITVAFLYTSFLFCNLVKFTYYFLILRNCLEFCCFGDSLQFSKLTIMSHAKKRKFYFFLYNLHSVSFFVLYYAV